MCDGLSQEEWAFLEDISVDYAFAQSVLFKIFGGIVQETGHKTRGHISLTEDDRCHSLYCYLSAITSYAVLYVLIMT